MLVRLLQNGDDLTCGTSGFRIEATDLDANLVPVQSAGLPAAGHEDIAADFLPVLACRCHETKPGTCATIAPLHDHRLGRPSLAAGSAAAARHALSSDFRCRTPAIFTNPCQLSLNRSFRQYGFEFPTIPAIHPQLARHFLHRQRSRSLACKHVLKVF